jgi:hypothetical protein
MQTLAYIVRTYNPCTLLTSAFYLRGEKHQCPGRNKNSRRPRKDRKPQPKRKYGRNMWGHTHPQVSQAYYRGAACLPPESGVIAALTLSVRARAIHLYRGLAAPPPVSVSLVGFCVMLHCHSAEYVRSKAMKIKTNVKACKIDGHGPGDE